ncbi:DUF2877 domain-containing protein [Solirubrobacter ginsenosidimutans]|uniref:DUF2877 domain-containing protein n=1 Tax=Solirubrobacter ginsenosidimutans TaxID=490573 RepID=A0A9X3MR53_9ACTN|nr:DUF2877 domain-containing protein [Solirubrobacter ginsenosidimutans]MDA0159678.1 DUF2877 domain-containing protein [Solirubrobacter ginsenosidimutans]
MTSTVVMTRALWAGPGAWRVLARGGTGVVEFALHPGGYARLGGEWLLLAIPRAPRGPLTLLVAGLEATPLAAGDDVALEYDFALRGRGVDGGWPPGRADADRRVVAKPPVRCLSDHDASRALTPPARVVAGDTSPPGRGSGRERPGGGVADTRHTAAARCGGTATLRAGTLHIDLAGLGRAHSTLVPPPLAPGWRGAVTAALDAAPSPPDALTAGLSALRRGDESEAVAELAGRGEGLTPAGDDVLAGYAAWCHAQGRETAVVALAAERAAPLGLAYLRCATRGELPEPAAAVLRAIRAGDVAAARRRAAGLSRWGASSGAAILWGIAAGAFA